MPNSSRRKSRAGGDAFFADPAGPTIKAAPCVHCTKRPGLAAWGLCVVCARDPRKRAKAGGRVYRPRAWLTADPAPAPKRSTTAKPGSAEKLRVIAGRALRRETTDHPEDRDRQPVCAYQALMEMMRRWCDTKRPEQRVYGNGRVVWRARVEVKGKHYRIGDYETEDLAILAMNLFRKAIREAGYTPADAAARLRDWSRREHAATEMSPQRDPQADGIMVGPAGGGVRILRKRLQH